MALQGVSLITTTAVVPGSYLSANITVNNEGRITAAASGFNSSFPVGTVWSFTQAAAPLGWTQVLSVNNVGIRLVNGTGGSVGGSIPFSTLFAASTTIGGTINITSGQVSDTVLSFGQMAYHQHQWALVDTVGSRPGNNPDLEGIDWPAFALAWDSSSTGSYQPHTHGLAGVSSNGTFSANYDLQYIDQILATKN
jgi:hypothetical protein